MTRRDTLRNTLPYAVLTAACMLGGGQAHAQGNTNGAGMPASGVNGVYPAPMEGVEPGVEASRPRATRTTNAAHGAHAPAKGHGKKPPEHPRKDPQKDPQKDPADGASATRGDIKEH
ncbi:hypothetical protein [Paraburkholderia sp. J94]|uniref:hypothetical protein n=1 Tax=Paraburkholderia sp. J94 TaxID=2805441 RepID=UPI002AB12D1C|nr:hypothetical protein [Paraburkholderia sp. J94]